MCAPAIQVLFRLRKIHFSVCALEREGLRAATQTTRSTKWKFSRLRWCAIVFFFSLTRYLYLTLLLFISNLFFYDNKFSFVLCICCVSPTCDATKCSNERWTSTTFDSSNEKTLNDVGHVTWTDKYFTQLIITQTIRWLIDWLLKSNQLEQFENLRILFWLH